MTIYSQITSNRVKTYGILLLFIVLISGFFYIIGKFFDSPGAYFVFGFIFSLASSLVSYLYSDKIVLFTVGAKPANRKEHFDFYTVTENLAIASGLPMPSLYVISDRAPNAFATGRNPKHAVVCATSGLLETLERRELEGVIAHELSHIKNYDILLSSLVAVLVGTISLVAEWIMRHAWWSGGLRDRNDEKNNRSPLLYLLFIISLLFIPVVATLIQLAVSRRREFLADASGALLTRYPEGLAHALERIAASPHVLRSASSSSAHLFITNPLKKNKSYSWFSSLFSTHPPVEERIKILRSM